jgi:hypothetical protein
MTFHGVMRAGGVATAAIWWFKLHTDDEAKEVAHFVLDQHQAMPRPIGETDDSQTAPTMLGQYEAYEAVDTRDRTLVRAVLLANGDAYAASLSVDKSPIDDHLYRLFDLVCRSFRFADDQ